ncbi:MAG: DUF2604 domain-containing protein [Acidimicrobiia bacterium]
MSRDVMSDEVLLSMKARGLRPAEIAAKYGLTPAAVRGRLQRLAHIELKQQVAFLAGMLCDLLDGCKGPHEIIEQTGMDKERAEAIYNWWSAMSHPGMVQLRPFIGDAAQAWLDDGRFDAKCEAIADIDMTRIQAHQMANTDAPARREDWTTRASMLALASAVLRELTPGIEAEASIDDPEPIHFIINGQTVRVMARATLGGLINLALEGSGNRGRPASDWDAMGQDGQLIPLDTDPRALRGRMVFLSLRVAGGDVAPVGHGG